MSMDTTFESPSMIWRSVANPGIQTAAYTFIIVWQGITAVVCFLGTLRLLRALHGSSTEFNEAKSLALSGLGMGFLLYAFGFIVIAGEWFAMWQSQSWNAQPAASRFILMIGVVALFLAQPDDTRREA